MAQSFPLRWSPAVLNFHESGFILSDLAGELTYSTIGTIVIMILKGL
jgi:hypothetical protein